MGLLPFGAPPPEDLPPPPSEVEPSSSSSRTAWAKDCEKDSARPMVLGMVEGRSI